MHQVSLPDVVKRYEAVDIVRAVTLTITDGEFVVHVGPSCCGKSTTLRRIVGLEVISRGALSIGTVWPKPPRDRNISIIFRTMRFART